jgi:hypothetical protein
MAVQTRLMSEAAIVVVPVGAGGWSAMQIAEGAALIELGPPLFSAVFGQRYQRLICERVPLPNVAKLSAPPDFVPGRHDHYLVPLDGLRTLVHAAAHP